MYIKEASDTPQDMKISSNKHVTVPSSPKILRFRKSERLVHWALAIPFLLCYGTALVLVFYYNQDPLRPYRYLFSWVHRISGISLIILPPLVMMKKRGDFSVYFYNIKQAWVWTLEDFKWLALMGLAAVSSKIKLPEQGKFNAAEKINFMTLMATYPLYILTGITIWLTDAAFLSWVVHFAMALFATPLVIGHLFMAIINPDTRKGLPGMFSGHVDSQWAKHHYTRWYREHFENNTGFTQEFTIDADSPQKNPIPSVDLTEKEQDDTVLSEDVI